MSDQFQDQLVKILTVGSTRMLEDIVNKRSCIETLLVVYKELDQLGEKYSGHWTNIARCKTQLGKIMHPPCSDVEIESVSEYESE